MWRAFVLPLILVLALMLTAAGTEITTPDFAIQSEVWELDTQTCIWDVRVCAIVVYFAGPVALEDRADCGLPIAVTTR